MLAIYLVEDEIIELNLMMNHIDWAGMGLRVVGSAKNGKKAWEQIQTLQPDIVLSDVRMPFMDGLQLAALIQARFDGIKVVFLSGHDEFTYVKSALDSGAVGYLLKPIDRRELSVIMDKAKAEVEKAKLLRRSKEVLIENLLAVLFVGADGGSREQAWRELVDRYPEYEDRKFVTALFSADGYSNLHAVNETNGRELYRTAELLQELLDIRGMEGMVVGLNEHEWLLALPAAAGSNAAGLWEEAQQAIQASLGWTVTVGVCDREGTLREGSSLFAKARQAANERFFAGPGTVVLDSRLHPRLDLGFGSLDEASQPGKLDLSDRERSIGVVSRFFDLARNLRTTKSRVLLGAKELLAAIASERAKYENSSGAAADAEEPAEWTRAIERAETLDEVREYMLELTGMICSQLEDRQQDRHLQLVQQVTDIIDREYHVALTIDYLAGKVYLSPNYLRVLFKEKKGCTVHEYLTRIRLNKSLELLRDKSLKIHDVASRVGYDNTSYFCSFFYKTQGVTPNEYRKKFL
ncbi:response regulator transcription factor [Paenibacillus sacheonensis]|uniref:Response regulator n=1 Tax=Paenibacillus sacheonensis TaxID=742054 RepID=A0A7X4YQ33_9BACL|nr:response regulator [Paenibacillus sacheonensis]MBM7566230.1 two-component system response regulator YesN [Paenibacillus sacheonensis]NBC70437.1 response regulator [Paenibacillus sacheonensis]